MDSSSQDKNLPATPRRLQKAREEGQVPRSRDLLHLVVLGGGLLMLSMLVPWGYDQLRTGMRASMTFDLSLIQHPEATTGHLVEGVKQVLILVLPLGLAVSMGVVLASVAAGSFVFSAKPMMPQLSKIGLLSGFQRLFSRQQFFEVLKLMAITTLLAVVASVFISSHMLEFGTLLLRPLPSSLSQMGKWFTVGVGGLLSVVALVALIDVPLQHYLHRHRLRMSLQEVKDEHKESEGNPQLKGRMRQRQREIAQRNSIGRVPKADPLVVGFFKKQLQEITVDWRDRRSRLER